MVSFILFLDPTTREELYADAALPFVELVLIEALVIILQSMFPKELTINEDGLTCDDPESSFLWSVEYLLYILQKEGNKEGVNITEEEIEYNSDLYESVSFRLSMALESIRAANCPTQIAALRDIFMEQAMGLEFNFKASHLGNQVVFTISSDV